MKFGSAVGIGFLLFAMAAGADESVELKGGGGGAQDLLNMTQIPSNLASPQASGQKAQVFLTCTDSNNVTYKQGDSQYEICMAQKQMEARTKAQPSNLPGSPTVNGVRPGQGVSVQFGK